MLLKIIGYWFENGLQGIDNLQTALEMYKYKFDMAAFRY